MKVGEPSPGWATIRHVQSEGGEHKIEVRVNEGGTTLDYPLANVTDASIDLHLRELAILNLKVIGITAEIEPL